MTKRRLLVWGLVALLVGGCAAAVVGVVAVGTVVVVSVVFAALAAALQDAIVQMGPECDAWPVQPTDAAAVVMLDLGKQTAQRRVSIDFEATGGYVDQFFGGEKVRVQVRWKKSGLLRIDVTGESKDANGAAVLFRRTFLRPKDHEVWCYDHAAKQLNVFDWTNADKEMRALSVLRWEPLPWFFPTAHQDLIRKRWKVETVGPTEQGVELTLEPANERWKMDGSVWLDPRTGMPTKLNLHSKFLGRDIGGDINVEHLGENAPLDDELFKPWTPDPKEGWQIDRHDLGRKEGAEAAARVFNGDGALAMNGSRN